MPELRSLARFVDGGSKLEFEGRPEMQHQTGIHSEINRYAVFKVDIGMLVVPAENLEKCIDEGEI